MHSWNDIIARRLDKIIYKRKYMAKTRFDSREIIVSDRSYLNWVSFNYLGLASHPAVIDAFIKAGNKYGVGSTGAPTLCGYSDEHKELAIELASWLGYEKCLLFTSGYQLAVGLFKQLADINTTIWLDKNCHASHIDGILSSKARFVTFNAETIDSVILEIKAQDERRHIVVSEGIFSMDGACTYLHKLISLKQDCPDNVLLVVDDAHGIGAFGKNGLGTFEQLNLKNSYIDLFIGTLGKAFASHGGFIAGASFLIDYLQQTVRSLLFSTCLPAAIAAAARASLRIINSDEGRSLRRCLQQNIRYFHDLANHYNLEIYMRDANFSAIQLLVFDNENLVKTISGQLLDLGILCGGIVYPTVSKTQPRIRISINAGHLPHDVEFLCDSLSKTMLKYA